jgi:hypothetical protein
MSLYIRIKDGQPFEHPLTVENMKLVFPNVDLDNLPTDFMQFVRVEKRDTKLYEVYENHEYVIDENVVKDIHNFRPMTLQEKDDYIQTITQEWQAFEFYKPSWIYSDTVGQFVAPVPYPEDGKVYKWDEASLSWVIAPKIESITGTDTGT